MHSSVFTGICLLFCLGDWGFHLTISYDAAVQGPLAPYNALGLIIQGLLSPVRSRPD